MPVKMILTGIFMMLVAAHLVQAAEKPEKVNPEDAKVILDRLTAARPDLNFGSISTTPIEGLYQVRVNDTQLLYVSMDGGYIIAGDMYQTKPGQLVPVADLELAEIRRGLLAGIPASESIIFSSKLPGGQTKAKLYVFTDVDCGYCRKLHNEAVPGLTQKGVEVHYLAFPRAGIGSPSYRKIASAWCANDRQTALTNLKNGLPVADNVCKDNPVAAQYELGQKMGVTGTPALVMEDGSMVPGYRPAEDLLKILGIN